MGGSQARTPWYAEGLGPAVGWTDRGKVDQTRQQVCVPTGCYSDTVVVAETSAKEPDAEQLKWYARGVGNVFVSWRGSGEKVKETVKLKERSVKASSAGLREVDAGVRALEKSALTHSTDVYAKTEAIKA